MAQISANERAALDTIRMAEGTWHGGGQKGYGTQFGGGQFDWRKGHPDRVVRSGGYASAAAGAYQFMPDTWKGVTKQLGADPRDFSPEAQDRAALQLIRNRGVDPTQPMTTGMLAKLSPEWASLPTAAGKSYYNQPVKGQKELLGFYSQRLGATGTGASGTGATGTSATPNPGNGASGTGASGTGATGAGATGTGIGMPPLPTMPAPLDLSGVIASLNDSIVRPKPPTATQPNPVLNALAGTLDELNAPLAAIRPQQSAPVAQPRMAASNDFMRPLLALTRR